MSKELSKELIDTKKDIEAALLFMGMLCVYLTEEPDNVSPDQRERAKHQVGRLSDLLNTKGPL